jgi:hypothetical protein
MMRDISPYGVTQNPDENAITANEMVGERAGLVTGDQLAGVSAAMFSTAPYRPPGGRYGCVGRDNKCKVAPIKGTNLCWFHTEKGTSEPPAAT